jgi:hypothetical protein
MRALFYYSVKFRRWQGDFESGTPVVTDKTLPFSKKIPAREIRSPPPFIIDSRKILK